MKRNFRKIFDIFGGIATNLGWDQVGMGVGWAGLRHVDRVFNMQGVRFAKVRWGGEGGKRAGMSERQSPVSQPK